MELPDWIWEEAHAVASAGGFSILIAVVRYGERDVDPASGGRRWRLKRSIPKLAAHAHIPTRTAERAIPELVEERFLWVSRAIKAHALRSFIVLADSPHPAKLAVSLDSETDRSAAGALAPSSNRFIRLESTTTTPDPANLAGWLHEEEVADAEKWIAKYGGERVWRCLYQLDNARERGRVIKSPAGFLFTLLESATTPLPVPSVGPAAGWGHHALDYVREHQLATATAVEER